jgi:rfaE bifunctional protein kinase chain/domain
MTRAFPSTGRLRDLVAAFAGRKVLVFADLIADRFVSGRARRISREAPVLILDQESDVVLPGGGANAVANIRALGGEPLLLGRHGDDPQGRALVEALLARGIEVGHLLELEGLATPTKMRVLGGGPTTVRQQIVRVDSGDRRGLSGAELDAHRAATAELLAASDPPAVVVFSDYGYGGVTPELFAAVREHAPDAVVLVDSRYRLGDFAGASGATPNQEEAEALLGAPLDDEAALRRHGPQLRARLGLDFLLITRGSRGMALFLEDRLLFLPISGGDEVVDVTGAGDTVIGAFSLAIAAGAQPAEAAAIANLAGGVVVHKQGTATASPAELVRALDRDRPSLEELEWDAS